MNILVYCFIAISWVMLGYVLFILWSLEYDIKNAGKCDRCKKPISTEHTYSQAVKDYQQGLVDELLCEHCE